VVHCDDDVIIWKLSDVDDNFYMRIKRLDEKLDFIGIKGTALYWFKSYFSDRFQCFLSMYQFVTVFHKVLHLDQFYSPHTCCHWTVSPGHRL